MRKKLFQNIATLRGALEEKSLRCMGRESAIVPVMVGDEFEIRVANNLISSRGVLTNIAEYPAVPKGRARLRLQVQANHTPEMMITAAKSIEEAVNSAKEYCSRTNFLGNE